MFKVSLSSEVTPNFMQDNLSAFLAFISAVLFNKAVILARKIDYFFIRKFMLADKLFDKFFHAKPPTFKVSFKLVAQAFSQQATIAHHRSIFTASHYGFSKSERPNLHFNTGLKCHLNISIGQGFAPCIAYFSPVNCTVMP